MEEEKKVEMTIITNYNKLNKKFLPMLSLIENIDETKKQIKKQIIDQIINEPSSLKAYKNLEIYQVGKITSEMEYTNTDKIKLFTYEELLNEIINDLTEKEKEDVKD